MAGEGVDDGIDSAGVEFVSPLFCPVCGEVGPGGVEGLGDVPEVAFGVKMSTIWIASGKHSSARVQIQGAPSPRMTLRSAAAKRRRWGFAADALGEGGKVAVGIAAGGVSMAAV